MTPPTPGDLRDLLVQILVGAAGGDKAQWRDLVGEMEKLSPAFNIKSNWRSTRPARPAR